MVLLPHSAIPPPLSFPPRCVGGEKSRPRCRTADYFCAKWPASQGKNGRPNPRRFSDPLSGHEHNYDDVRGKGLFGQTRRERRAYPRVDLQGASNEVWSKKICRPAGCAEFDLWLRCSSVTAPWRGCSLLEPRHRPNWAQRTLSYLCSWPLGTVSQFVFEIGCAYQPGIAKAGNHFHSFWFRHRVFHGWDSTREGGTKTVQW